MPKPWMRQREGESVRAFHARLNRTCHACGKECASMAACDEHEKECPRIRATGRKKET